jgi:hypothetical protein
VSDRSLRSDQGEGRSGISETRFETDARHGSETALAALAELGRVPSTSLLGQTTLREPSKAAVTHEGADGFCIPGPFM